MELVNGWKKTTRLTVALNLPVAVLLRRDVYEEGNAEEKVAKHDQTSSYESTHGEGRKRGRHVEEEVGVEEVLNGEPDVEKTRGKGSPTTYKANEESIAGRV